MTWNNDKEYFKEHPQYHMYLHPEMPSYEQQMAARDECWTKPSVEIRWRPHGQPGMERGQTGGFPRPLIRDTWSTWRRAWAGGISIQQDLAKVRRFFIRYQDRLLYGTDCRRSRDDPQEVRRDAHAAWLHDWQYLATGLTFRVPGIGCACMA